MSRNVMRIRRLSVQWAAVLTACVMCRGVADDNVLQQASSALTAAAGRLLDADRAAAKVDLEASAADDVAARRTLAMLADLDNADAFVADFLRSKIGEALYMTIGGAKEKVTVLGVDPGNVVRIAREQGRAKIVQRTPVGELNAVERLAWLGKMPHASQALYRGLLASSIGNSAAARRLLAEADPVGPVMLGLWDQRVAVAAAAAAEDAEKKAHEKRLAEKAATELKAQEDQGATESAKAMQALFGTSLRNAGGARVSAADLAGKKVAIYFSAQWCPPCRAFTPKLVEAYTRLKAENKPFEVVFVSSDRNEKDMKKYIRDYKMSWLHVNFGDPEQGALRKRFGVSGIPMLAVVDAEGKTLPVNARNDVMSHGAAAFDRW